MPDFQVGQQVILHSGPTYAPTEKVAKIEKITPTGVIRVEGSAAMFARDGRQKGGERFHRARIEPCTPDALARIDYRKTRARVSDKAEKLGRALSLMQRAKHGSLSSEAMKELERTLDEALAVVNPETPK